jgi:hypothetical protein
VEQQYNRLQQEGQSVTQGIQGLAGKLKTAADGGSADAREWLLDLKELALNVQQEQQQVMMLMQAMHQAVQNELQQLRTATIMATGLPANATGTGLSPGTAATGRIFEQPGTLRFWAVADDGRGLRD